MQLQFDQQETKAKGWRPGPCLRLSCQGRNDTLPSCLLAQCQNCVAKKFVGSASEWFPQALPLCLQLPASGCLHSVCLPCAPEFGERCPSWALCMRALVRH